VFRLMPPVRPQDPWRETIIHQFSPSTGDGGAPAASPVFGSDGGLYGATGSGGPHGAGIVYQLQPLSGTNGEWKERVLHNFTGSPDDKEPWAGVVFGHDGCLYGTSLGRPGSVFQLRPTASSGGEWDETIIHPFRFQSSDGEGPVAEISVGENSELYGTTEWGGIAANGTVFELTPPSTPGGAWAHTVLHRFMSHAADGSEPVSGLRIGPRGELYGTTYKGGAWGLGTIFRLTPPAQRGEEWAETILYNFAGRAGDGHSPRSDPHLIFDQAGAVLGTTVFGGAFDKGTVFRFVLREHASR